MEGENDGPVTLGNSFHGTVDSAKWSLHIMFLHDNTMLISIC